MQQQQWLSTTGHCSIRKLQMPTLLEFLQAWSPEARSTDCGAAQAGRDFHYTHTFYVPCCRLKCHQKQEAWYHQDAMTSQRLGGGTWVTALGTAAHLHPLPSPLLLPMLPANSASSRTVSHHQVVDAPCTTTGNSSKDSQLVKLGTADQASSSRPVTKQITVTKLMLQQLTEHQLLVVKVAHHQLAAAGEDQLAATTVLAVSRKQAATDRKGKAPLTAVPPSNMLRDK